MGGGGAKGKKYEVDPQANANLLEAVNARKAMLDKLIWEHTDLRLQLEKTPIASTTASGPRKVALLTAGGLAPCLSSAVGGLIHRYNELYPHIKMIGYIGGYKGLLLGQSYEVTAEVRRHANLLHGHGGSPIGNSRVKLTNIKDCVKRGLVKEGEDPLTVAANQLVKDGVDVLHTIGGDDTNLAAADLAEYLLQNKYPLIVIGLPKTIDNDVYPIKQTLGAWTAAEEGAKFFRNVVNEQSANHRMLIVHEVMGRSCGYLTAATARDYRERLKSSANVPSLGLHFEKLDIHAVYIPEIPIDIEAEAKRLSKVMDNCEVVNIFVSEGAGVESIVKEMEARGQEIPRDAFGHVKLDAVNVGDWFASNFAGMVNADKTMVQKSGYFSRASAANPSDIDLIKSCCDLAVDCAMHGKPGVIGHDEDHNNTLRAIEFKRIKGGKPFDVNLAWFREMMAEIQAPVRLENPKLTYLALDFVPKLLPGMTLPKKVAILTAGGLAPCLSSVVGGLIERYNELFPNVELLCYTSGYRGLLRGESIRVSTEARRDAGILHMHGGSPLGCSRVTLTAASCSRRSVIGAGEDPHAVAAAQLLKDGVDVLHTIENFGDGVGAGFAEYLKMAGHDIKIIGLPKTIDNDIFPIKQALGAWTAAEEGAKYFANVVYESSANPRMLIIHEVMGAQCGYLTAATAEMYRNIVHSRGYCAGIGLSKSRYDVHGVFIPEIALNIQAEAARLKEVMLENDCVNIFLCEGAGIEAICDDIEQNARNASKTQTVQADLDEDGKVNRASVNPSNWFAKKFAAMIGAEKVLVQKSGYFSRSAVPNMEDIRLIKSCTDHAVECAIRGESGVVAHDEENQGVLRAIEFEQIKGGKPFDIKQPWFIQMLASIGQKTEYGANAARVCEVTDEDMNALKVRMNVVTGDRRNSALFA